MIGIIFRIGSGENCSIGVLIIFIFGVISLTKPLLKTLNENIDIPITTVTNNIAINLGVNSSL